MTRIQTPPLPVLQEGQIFETVSASVREGKTSPPKHYTEDSLLAAMETADAGDMPEDAERKGLGTPATRAATLEKLVSAGFVQREKKQLIPTEKGTNLILVLPDNIKSPMLTAEWGIHVEAGGTRRAGRRILYGADCGYEPDAGKGAYRPGGTFYRSVPRCKEKRA